MSPHEEVRIRFLEASDAAQLDALSRDLGLHLCVEDELSRENSRVTVGELSGGPVAFLVVACLGEEAEIVDLGVASTVQRRGIARLLLEELQKWAKRERVVAIHLEVRAGNVPALRLYRDAGFVEVGRRRRYYSDGEDALLLTLDVKRV